MKLLSSLLILPIYLLHYHEGTHFKNTSFPSLSEKDTIYLDTLQVKGEEIMNFTTKPWTIPHDMNEVIFCQYFHNLTPDTIYLSVMTSAGYTSPAFYDHQIVPGGNGKICYHFGYLSSHRGPISTGASIAYWKKGADWEGRKLVYVTFRGKKE